eukprot:369818-Hanusia_phi.AAC.1
MAQPRLRLVAPGRSIGRCHCPQPSPRRTVTCLGLGGRVPGPGPRPRDREESDRTVVTQRPVEWPRL